jgi:hypothetical protein
MRITFAGAPASPEKTSAGASGLPDAQLRRRGQAAALPLPPASGGLTDFRRGRSRSRCQSPSFRSAKWCPRREAPTGKGLKFICFERDISNPARGPGSSTSTSGLIRSEGGPGRRSAAETACDRFALRNYRRIRVSADAADEALERSRLTGLPASPVRCKTLRERPRRRGGGREAVPADIMILMENRAGALADIAEAPARRESTSKGCAASSVRVTAWGLPGRGPAAARRALSGLGEIGEEREVLVVGPRIGRG